MKKNVILLFILLLLCNACITGKKITKDVTVFDEMVVTKTITVKTEKIKMPEKKGWGENDQPKYFFEGEKRLDPKIFQYE
jgi:hypothetical protein